MRKGLILLLFLIFGVILFIITLQKVGFHTVREALSAFSFFQMAIAFIVLFSGIVGMGTLRWRNIMKSLGIESFKFSKLILVKIVGFSLSYVTPAALFGGEPARFLILRSDNENKNSLVAASIILDKIIQFLASFLFFFAGLFLLIFYLDFTLKIKIILFLVILSLIVGLWLLVKRIKKISNKKSFFIVLTEKLYLKKFIKSNN